MKGFPAIARAIEQAQIKASKVGYTETILGRRRHHPNMMLPRFEFEPMPGYVNPDIDPLDPKSLENKEQIPKRIIEALTKEFNSLKWYGKIVKRTKELAEEKIKVINNSYKIEEASRQVFNCVDKETEILTLQGWKKYNEIHEGDEILSYSIKKNILEEDTILAIHDYNKPAEVVEFDDEEFSACCTLNHKWIVKEDDETVVRTTKELLESDNHTLIRNSEVYSYNYLDTNLLELSLLGKILSQGTYIVKANGDVCDLSLTVLDRDGSLASDYKLVIDWLNLLKIDRIDEVVSTELEYSYHKLNLWLPPSARLNQMIGSIEAGSFRLANRLNKDQCETLIRSIFDKGYNIEDDTSTITLKETCADVLQYIAFRANMPTIKEPLINTEKSNYYIVKLLNLTHESTRNINLKNIWILSQN